MSDVSLLIAASIGLAFTAAAILRDARHRVRVLRTRVLSPDIVG